MNPSIPSLEWRVADPRVTTWGEFSEKVNLQAGDLIMELVDTAEPDGVSVPDHRSATRLADEIHRTVIDIRNYEPSLEQGSFDRLVARHLKFSLAAQEEYLRFAFTPLAYRKLDSRRFNPDKPRSSRQREHLKKRVTDLLDSQFMRASDPRAKPWRLPERTHRGAINYVERLVRDIDYDSIAARRRELGGFHRRPFDTHPEWFDIAFENILPDVRRSVADFNVDYGFWTPAERDANEEHARARLRQMRDAWRRFFVLGEDVRFLESAGKGRDAIRFTWPVRGNPTGAYDLLWGESAYSYADWRNHLTLLRNSLVLFTLDRTTSTPVAYTGDLHRTAFHENIHQRQRQRSLALPAGVRVVPDSYNLYDSVITEGVPTFAETWCMDWLGPFHNRYGLTRRDLDVARRGEVARDANHLLRALYLVLKQEYFGDGLDDESLEARRELVRISGNEAFYDDDNLPQDSFHAMIYGLTYPFGELYVGRALDRLVQAEARHHKGTIEERTEAARALIHENRPTVLSGMVAGSWGWHTFEDWLVKHYWPRARELITE
jgi:hypothetical protein